jgi:hypothetical protein
MIIKWILEEQDEGMVDWIHLAHDRDQWRTLVRMVLDFRVPQNAGKFLKG